MAENRRFTEVRLGERQMQFVRKFLDVDSPANHILFAPVGSGKTVIASSIINELFSAGATRMLFLVPAVVLMDQYIRVLRENQEDFKVIELNRKAVREIESLRLEESSLANSLAIATLQQAVNEEIKESIFSTFWDLIIIEDAEHLTSGSKYAALIKMIVEKQIAKRILIFSNEVQAIPSSLKMRSLLNSHSFENFERTEWRHKDIFLGKSMRSLQFSTQDYERTKEEVDFIKKYIGLSKWLSNRSFQNKIRSRLVSSSLYAAEKSLRDLRNRLVHEDLRSVLSINDAEIEFIKDEELLGDANRSQVDRKFSSKDFPKLLNDLSATLALLDKIQSDSKFNTLSQVLKNFQRQKQWIWIYTAYQSTISYLYSSLLETNPNTYQVHGQMPSHLISEGVQRFRDNGGILIASSIIATGIDFPLNLLVFYDIPGNELIVSQMIGRLFRSVDEEITSQPAKVFTFYDKTKVLPTEISRYTKLQKTMSSIAESH